MQNSEKDTKRKALLAAAEQGDPDAIVELAVFYHGEGKEKECKKWITNGARLRETYCMGQMAVYLSIAGLSANDSNRYGNDRSTTDTTAMYYLTQAAEAGHPFDLSACKDVLPWFVTCQPDDRLKDLSCPSHSR